MPWTFSYYIAQRFLRATTLTSCAFFSLFYIINILELLRRAPSDSDISFPFLLRLASLQLPGLFEEALPFIILLASLVCFVSLSQSQELTVMRTSGFSVWQLTTPMLLTILPLATLFILLLQPISATLTLSYNTQQDIHIRKKAPSIRFLATGLWIYDVTQNTYKIIHTKSVRLNANLFEDVTFFLFTSDNTFGGRLEAKSAILKQKQWHLQNATFFSTTGEKGRAPQKTLPSSLTLEDIKERSLSPKTISVWDLPHFIEITEKTGLPTIPFTLYLHTLLLLPLLLCGHALIGLSLALYSRRISVIAIAGLVTLGGLFFLSSLCMSLAASGDLSALKATFIPVIVSICLGLLLLHYREYG